jgi:hypothetical protein
VQCNDLNPRRALWRPRECPPFCADETMGHSRRRPLVQRDVAPIVGPFGSEPPSREHSNVKFNTTLRTLRSFQRTSCKWYFWSNAHSPVQRRQRPPMPAEAAPFLSFDGAATHLDPGDEGNPPSLAPWLVPSRCSQHDLPSNSPYSPVPVTWTYETAWSNFELVRYIILGW